MWKIKVHCCSCHFIYINIFSSRMCQYDLPIHSVFGWFIPHECSCTLHAAAASAYKKYICRLPHTHVWIFICICVCIYVYTCMYVCMYICVYVCMYIYLCVYVCKYITADYSICKPTYLIYHFDLYLPVGNKCIATMLQNNIAFSITHIIFSFCFTPKLVQIYC